MTGQRERLSTCRRRGAENRQRRIDRAVRTARQNRNRASRERPVWERPTRGQRTGTGDLRQQRKPGTGTLDGGPQRRRGKTGRGKPAGSDRGKSRSGTRN